jgi:Type II secretory pathway, ATPase PulE/Tfp pilus assembly pathway, ATPase PilB
MPAPTEDLPTRLRGLDAASHDYATQFVEILLAGARERATSDVHLQPTSQGLAIRWRIDGVLHPLGEFPRGQAADVVTRLKVLAGLLTYKTDVPQEGRIAAAGDCEMRVSTFPTLYGERAVVRLFVAERQFLSVADLRLPSEIELQLSRLLDETSGAILITGPAGSGKTTTAYACLRHIAAHWHGQRSIVSLEDPIEMALQGVAQSQVNAAAGFDLPTGLRSLMRQDPEVILVGEIRDAETAATAFQASLTGHLVMSTFHAGSAASGLARVIDLGIEPYLVRSGIRAVLHQRLVRRLCECARSASEGTAGATAGLSSNSGGGVSSLLISDPFLGLPIRSARIAAGCPACSQTGYRGRLVLAELLPPLEGELGRAVLARSDVRELHRHAVAGGMTTIFQRACQVAESGQTDPAEIRRVVGFNTGSAGSVE